MVRGSLQVNCSMIHMYIRNIFGGPYGESRVSYICYAWHLGSKLSYYYSYRGSARLA